MIAQTKRWSDDAPGGRGRGLNSHALLVHPSQISFDALLRIAQKSSYIARTNTDQDVIEAWATDRDVRDWKTILNGTHISFFWTHHHCTGKNVLSCAYSGTRHVQMEECVNNNSKILL